MVPHRSSGMRLISLLFICLGLSACATDYASQLYEPGFGIRDLHLSPENVDPTLLMNGTYASKQMNGFYISKPFCSPGYRCSQQPQQWSSQDPWAP
jgi:hypothetical protein